MGEAFEIATDKGRLATTFGLSLRGAHPID